MTWVNRTAEIGHVMISYSWKCAKNTVLEISKRLKAAGFKVWIDEDKMGT